MYWRACRTWHIVKVDLIRLVGILETWAEQEKEWDDANPGRPDTTSYDIKSSSLAVEIARHSTPFLEWLPFEKKLKRSGGKSVRFEDDIVEWPKREQEGFQ
jgi:hypothetical protein